MTAKLQVMTLLPDSPAWLAYAAALMAAYCIYEQFYFCLVRYILFQTRRKVLYLVPQGEGYAWEYQLLHAPVAMWISELRDFQVAGWREASGWSNLCIPACWGGSVYGY